MVSSIKRKEKETYLSSLRQTKEPWPKAPLVSQRDRYLEVLPWNKINFLPDDDRTSHLLNQAIHPEVAIQWEESTVVVQSGPTLQGWRLPEALADSGESKGHSGPTQVCKQGEGKEIIKSLKENYC